MIDLFSGGVILVIIVGVAVALGGWMTIDDYLSRNKDHKGTGNSGQAATHKQ